MKMRKLSLLPLLLLGASMLRAQNTTVTATVVDSDTTVWANAPWTLAFQPGPQNSNAAAYTIGGSPLAANIIKQNGTANGSGVISFTVYQSTAVSPIQSSWNLSVCPNAISPCASLNFSTSTSSVDISSIVNALIRAPRFVPISGAYGYNDTEAIIQLKPGSTYWNVTSNVQKCYTGSAWGSCSISGGPPTGAAGGVLSGTYPNPGAAAPQAVTITALSGVDPTHGGTAFCATLLGFVCNSTSGVVQLTYGATPADDQAFAVNWTTAKASLPVALAAPVVNSTTTATWVLMAFPVVEDSDNTTTTKVAFFIESATGGTTVGQIAYVAYHIDPVLP